MESETRAQDGSQSLQGPGPMVKTPNAEDMGSGTEIPHAMGCAKEFF